MAKPSKFTLNSTCGLPCRICAEWQRRSFRTLPDELINYRTPKTKPEAKANIQVLIAFLKKNRDALPEDEMIKLFGPGVLKSTMELAVCAAMFLSGLRRSEIFALKPEDLD